MHLTQLPTLPSPPEEHAVVDWDSYPSLNDIRSLAFAPYGALWAGTSSGVVRWDLGADTHIRYSTADGLASDDITDITLASDGTLWVAARGGGISRFDGTGWTSYTEADGLISNIVYSITAAPDGSVWIGTQEGVSHFDCQRSGMVWTNYTMADGLADDVVWYVAVAPDGDVWFSTHSGGVSRYSPSQDTWMTYGTEHGLPLPNARFITIGPQGAPWLHVGYDHVYRFDGVTWQVAYEAGGGQWVCDIAFDADEFPWIATCGGYHAYGAGLAHFDGSTWTYATAEYGLVANDISAVAVSPDGTIAAGTIAAGTDRGLSVYKAGRWRVLRTGPTLNRVTALAVTPDGVAWFGFGDDAFRSAGGGLSRFDGQSWQYVDHAGGFPASDNVRVLAVAPDGALWAGAGCGVARLEGPSETAAVGESWQIIATCDDLHGNVLDIAFGPEGTAWVATGFGLASFDSRSQTDHDRKVHALVTAPDGAIWMNGWEELQGSGYVARFDGESWTTHQVADSFPGSFRVGAVTSDGRVWGIVAEGGVACFDGGAWADSRSWTLYEVSNQVFDLAVAPHGVLWAVTDEGIAFLDADSWRTIILNYTPGPGTINSLAFAPDGSIWLGTTRGSIHLPDPETAPTRSMKGYELYSWQVGEAWLFALLTGTNRIKGFDEITTPGVRLQGLEALEDKLDQLPDGEQVFWSAGRVWNAILPSGDVIEQVRAYCEQRGLQLEVEEVPPQPIAESPTTTLEPTLIPDTPAPISTPPPSPATHTVQPGENLFRIGLKYGVSVDDLRTANGIVGDLIYAGQVLTIPSSSVQTPLATPSLKVIEVGWDPSPTALVIRYYSPYTTASLAGAYNRNYYIPEVQVWRDGRIIWVKREGIGRRVLEGFLTADQLRGLVQRISDAAFFTWEDKYYTLGGNSYPPMHLWVSLAGQTKEVSEHGGAPDAFYELRDFLTSGAGAVGRDYLPTRGYLTATPDPDVTNAPQWPDATAGITLDQIGDGRYIEGEALALAWQLVNNNPTAPVYVRSNGQAYFIMVQVPGVSFFDTH